jgi:M6 family metalloprotease-like protein
MRINSTSKSSVSHPRVAAFFNRRVLLAVLLCSVGGWLAMLSFAGTSTTSPDAIAAQPPFPPVENKVTNGGLTLVAKVVTPAGWVRPNETFPVLLTYQAGGTAVAGVTIKVTLHSASIFLTSTPLPASGNGTPGSPLTYNIAAVPANGTGQIVVEARAKKLIEDPEVMWKDISADVTLAAGGQPALPAKTRGPKVTTLETARYGDNPFPVVMVQYQDVKHCTGPGAPFPECTSNHTAAALDTAVNSRTTGKSLWQLFHDMALGQFYLEGRVSPVPNSPTTPFTPGYVHKFSTPAPQGTCTGTTVGVAYGTPAYANRIENGWYLLPGTQGYYGADRTGHALAGALTGQGLLFGVDDACGPTGKIAYDAASLADADIDYNDFDSDKDGLVDFFNMMFAGDGGNGSVSPSGLNNVWPHSSDLRSYFTDVNGLTGYVSNDQFRNRLNQLMYYTDANRTTMTTTVTAFPVYVRVGPYNVNPETAIDSVSVIGHEYLHALGMPDFYSTGSRGTYGSWDLGATDYFQYTTVFTRQELGWVVPKPLPSGPVALTESKFDTGQITWNRPDGTPYTLTGPGIHNANVYRVGLPPRRLIDSVPSGVRAWYSGSGNDFGCATDGGGHNLDFFIPDLQQYGTATAVTLKIKHLYEIEWDYDYGFVLVSTDGGRNWTSLVSQNSSTISNVTNPNANACMTAYNNGITGVSEGPGGNNTATNPNRYTGTYPPAVFINDQFDLTPYKGMSILLRFSYSTDPGLAKRGWFIDDIEIKADDTVVYASDFEASQEPTRIFPDNWVRVSSADGSPADHAYYIELRDRISNDFDGKGQSERGSPTWQGGVSMIYTDEAHGYGNFGVDNPPAQTPVDSEPEPGNDTPNLNDAAFTPAAGRNEFDGCTHIDNYSDPNGPGGLWKLPPYLNFTVTGMTGMTGPSAALPPTPATATLVADVYPSTCDVALAPPVLAIGAGYENPDTDGSYQLTWTRPPGAVGPDLLQVATSCGPTFVDDASEPLVAGSNSLWEGSPQWSTQINPSDNSESYYIPDAAAQDESLTLINPIAIPAGFSSTLTFTTRQGLEASYDFGHVEVSTNGGASFTTMVSYSGPPGLGGTPLDVFEGQRTVDLSQFAGQSIIVRFRVESDSYNEGQPAGWYIDNIAITNSDWTDLVNTSGTTFQEHKASGTYCYRVRTTFMVGGSPLPSGFSNVVNVTVVPGVTPIVSRIEHGPAGTFDVDLPATGSPGIECRSGGAGNNYTLVYHFANPLTSVDSATVSQGTGTITSRAIGPNPNQYTVNLTGVTNAQELNVKLDGVQQTAGGTLNNIVARMGVLLGDTTANRAVNASDIGQAKAQSGLSTDGSNFRLDVTVNGVINASDIGLIKSKSGTALP